MHRDDARPRLKTVHQAIEELALLVNNETEILAIGFHEKWLSILNKYDINYEDTQRWDCSPRDK